MQHCDAHEAIALTPPTKYHAVHAAWHKRCTCSMPPRACCKTKPARAASLLDALTGHRIHEWRSGATRSFWAQSNLRVLGWASLSPPYCWCFNTSTAAQRAHIPHASSPLGSAQQRGPHMHGYGKKPLRHVPQHMRARSALIPQSAGGCHTAMVALCKRRGR